jgi:hypothetical protein
VQQYDYQFVLRKPTVVDSTSTHTLTDWQQLPGVWTQYDLTNTVIPTSNRRTRITVSSDVETINVAINNRGLAGLVGCLGGALGFAQISPVDGNYSVTINSCPIDPLANYFVGVSLRDGTTASSTDFTITIETVDPEIQGSRDLNLNGKTNFAPDALGIDYLSLTTSSEAPNGDSVYYVEVSTDTPVSGLTYSTDWTCDPPYNTYSCDFSTSTQCSAIIFPCLYVPSYEYYFNLNTIPGSITDITITTEVKEASLTNVNLPESDSFTTISGTVLVHDLALYKIPIDGDNLRPGEVITITLSDISCGSVDVWINQGYSAGGAACTISPVCKYIGCQLLSLSPCKEITDELLGDYYITVRGTDQYNPGDEIPARFSITVDRSGGVEKRQINPNEIALIYATPVEIPPPVCPLSTPTDIDSCAKCNDPSTVAKTYSVKPVVWNYPLDGAEFIGDIEVSISVDLGAETNNELTGARLNILYDFPDFCDDTLIPQQCTINSVARTCTININRCADFRQIYIWVDNLNYQKAGSIPGTLESEIKADQINLAKLTIAQAPKYVLDVIYKSEPQYLLFTLNPGETQYVRVTHDPDRHKIPNYLFQTNLIRLPNNGNLRIRDGWDYCNTNDICSDNGPCKDYRSSSQCPSDPITPCACQFFRTSCQISDNDPYTYFRLYSDGYTTGKIQFDFRVTQNEITNECDNIDVNGVKHYVSGVDPKEEQVYYYTLTHLSAQGTVHLGVGENDLIIPNSVCSSYQEIYASDFLKFNELYFRQGGDEIFVGIFEIGESFGVQNYLLTEDVKDVNPVSLENGKWTSLGYASVDSITGCSTQTKSNYFKYKASGSEMLIVELETNIFANVYVHKGHVTYNWGTWSCSSSSYCKILIACGGISGDTYYFHIPTGNSAVDGVSIRVTEHTINDKPKLSFNQRTQVDINDYLPVSFETDTFNPEKDPTQHLYISWSNINTVTAWVTRGSFGDPSCGVVLSPETLDYIADISASGPAVPHCRLVETNDKYYVNFMKRGSDSGPSCQEIDLFVRADLESRSAALSNDDVLVPEQDSYSEDVYTTVRHLFDVALNQDSVIYLRVPNLEYGSFTEAIVLKGPADIDNDPYAVPTDAGQSCSACSDSSRLEARAAWFDQCWHCSAIDTIYVDFTIGDAALQHSKVDYSVTSEVVPWIGLSGSPTTFDLQGSALSYGFYTTNLPSDQGINIQVEVTSGAIAIVSVYTKDCAQRIQPFNAITTVYCLLGVKCSILTSDSNIGKYKGELRIVVEGEDIKGTIAAYTGDQVCAGMTGDNAPFCSKVGGYSVVGDGGTFEEKDRYAEYYYNDILLQGFASTLNTGCRLSQLSDDCITKLKQYACQVAMPQCSGGYGLLPKYSTCTEIEDACGAKFADVGLESLDCNHNFYDGGITWVGPGDDDVPSDSNSGDDSPNLWLIFLIIPIIVIIIIIIVIVRIVTSGGEGAAAGSSGYQAGASS